MRELILGGQRSGKSRTAEARAAAWLARPGREAVLIATALAGDAEMAGRIVRHRAARASRVPRLATHEEPRHLAAALGRHSAAHRLVVVDCLTLWLTQLALPPEGAGAAPEQIAEAVRGLLAALAQARGPVVLVSNEIGLGVAPLSAEARRVVDALGVLHQDVAAACERVTLMVAGIECRIKGASAC